MLLYVSIPVHLVEMFIKYIAKEIIPPYGKSINKRFITTYVYPANILYMNFYEYIVY